jgi:hypothetical protein
MNTIVVPTQSSDIGMRQVKSLVMVAPGQRWTVLAEGLPVLLKSAEGLYAASRAIKDEDRAREILEGHAEEEAAKILVLLDFVRCPLGLSAEAQRVLSRFYDHGTRLIYAQACTWRPTDVNELRRYVDRERRSHYLEGYAGEYILPNSQVFAREARLHADLLRNQDGSFVWNDPTEMFASGGSWHFPPAVIKVARALAKVGAFSVQGLEIIHRLWSAKPFVGPEYAQEADGLIQQTLAALIDAGLPSAEADQPDAQTIYSYWQMPMYAIDTKRVQVNLEDLHAAQERELYAQM